MRACREGATHAEGDRAAHRQGLHSEERRQLAQHRAGHPGILLERAGQHAGEGLGLQSHASLKLETNICYQHAGAEAFTP